MNTTHPAVEGYSGYAYYMLHLNGHLDEEWAVAFACVSLKHENDGTTTLYGLVDQATLHGLLRKVRDAGVVLLAVKRSEANANENIDKGVEDV